MRQLCTDGVLHVYDTPEQAALMQHVYCRDYTRAWIVASDDEGISDGITRGIRSCTILQEIKLPELTTDQCVEIAIRVALLLGYDYEYYQRWADGWLSGRNRSAAAADAAASVADADDTYAARAAAYAATAAGRAVRAAADAANAVRTTGLDTNKIDLQAIIDQVLGRAAQGEA
jgi:hypothetical protein